MKIIIEVISDRAAKRKLSGSFEYPHMEDAIVDLARKTGLEVYEVLYNGDGDWVIVAHDEGPCPEKPDVRKKPGEYSRSM